MALEKRLDILVREAREQTGNADYTATTGIKQRQFVRWANDAQTRIYNKMQDTHTTLFTKEGFLDAVQGQASYLLPADAHISQNIVKAEYSMDGNVQGYQPLELRTPKQEVSVPGYPTSYFCRNGSMIVSPIPQSSAANAFRLNYQYSVPTLDIRRANITAHDLASITLTSDSLLLEETEDDLEGGWVDYVCVVSNSGTQIATSIPVTSYNSTTKIISCTLTSTQSAAIVNGSHKLVFGYSATTHAALPNVCDRYITAYMTVFAQMRDSNKEAVDSGEVLKGLEMEIVQSIDMLEEDVMTIPIADYSMLNYSEDL